MKQQSIMVSNTNSLTQHSYLSSLLTSRDEAWKKDGNDQMANSEDKDGTMMQLLMRGETGKQWNKGNNHCHGNWRIGALGDCWQDEAAHPCPHGKIKQK
jgi:hypothetical protein